jgi:hypothetical protein
VAFILKDDARVIGVEMEFCKGSKSVALIQIATADVVLLIPISNNTFSTLKALHIIFRDPEIVKTGVNIEKNLKVLLENFQIESHSFVELNELIKFSNSEIGSLSDIPNSPLTLQAIATTLGYSSWQTPDMIFSTWQCQSLSWKQLWYAARNALMTIKIYWRIVLGCKFSKPIYSEALPVNIGGFVDSVCTRGSISKRDDNVQWKSHEQSWELPSPLKQIITPCVYGDVDSISKGLFIALDDRMSTFPDIPPGLG